MRIIDNTPNGIAKASILKYQEADRKSRVMMLKFVNEQLNFFFQYNDDQVKAAHIFLKLTNHI